MNEDEVIVCNKHGKVQPLSERCINCPERCKTGELYLVLEFLLTDTSKKLQETIDIMNNGRE